jgi:hypothetical protein
MSLHRSLVRSVAVRPLYFSTMSSQSRTLWKVFFSEMCRETPNNVEVIVCPFVGSSPTDSTTMFFYALYLEKDDLTFCIASTDLPLPVTLIYQHFSIGLLVP